MGDAEIIKVGKSAWDLEFNERKEFVRKHLVKGGEIEWNYFYILEGLSEDEAHPDLHAAISILVDDMKILTPNPRGFYVTAHGGICCNPRAPLAWGILLYFVNRKDCEDYAAFYMHGAQYHWSIEEMT